MAVSDLKILDSSNSWNLIPKIGFHITQLSDIVQKSLCTSDVAMDLTFQMIYVPAVYHVCSRRNWAKTVAKVLVSFFLFHTLVA